jgi:hypothetical protein
MPPQAQKAFVRELFRPSRGGPSVSCALVSEHPGEAEIEFANNGGEIAADIRYVIAQAEGSVTGWVGHLPPDGATTVPLRAPVAVDPVRCVWMCTDGKRRLHVWSYDGRHKRLGRRRTATDDACFRMMYG